MKNKSQKEWVIQQLLSKGKISRNFALKNYISRLGAIICDLKEEGWDFNGYFIDSDKPDGGKGKNYVYEIVKCPFKKKVYVVEGKEIVEWIIS